MDVTHRPGFPLRSAPSLVGVDVEGRDGSGGKGPSIGHATVNYLLAFLRVQARRGLRPRHSGPEGPSAIARVNVCSCDFRSLQCPARLRLPRQGSELGPEQSRTSSRSEAGTARAAVIAGARARHEGGAGTGRGGRRASVEAGSDASCGRVGARAEARTAPRRGGGGAGWGRCRRRRRRR